MIVVEQINNNLEITFLLISIAIVLFFFFYLNSISLKLNIYDLSDNKRKFHKKKVPPIGGIIFFLIFCLYILFISFIYESKIFFHEKHIVVLFITSLLMFLTGLVDDKSNLTSNKKTIIFLILISTLVLNDNELIIFFLRTLSFSKTLALGNISIPFTIFCFFVFINAFNMFDGINLQSGLYLFSIFSFLVYKNIEPLLFVPLAFTSLIFLYYNFNNKVFLGNCGSYFLPFIISAFLIKSNINLSLISLEEILILMIIPGLDLTRLFFKRLVQGKNPFNADRGHIHHLLSDKYSQIKSVIIIFSTIFFPIILSQIVNNILLIIVQVCIYLSLVFLSKKNSN